MKHAVFALLLALPAARAEVKLPKVFSSRMVLQREMPVPVWGTAAPGEKVTVAFRDQAKTSVAAADGNWRVVLDPLQAGGPDTLVIGGITLEDVLVGEVWLGSGQSNMDMPVKSYTAGDPLLAQLATNSYPRLRLLGKDPAAAWRVASPESIPGFSAQLFAFGQSLQAHLDVPVGLMVGAVGGTPSGKWLTPDMLKADPEAQAVIARFAASSDHLAARKALEEAHAAAEVNMTAWKTAAEEARKAGKPAPAKPPVPRPVSPAGEITGGRMGELFERYIRPLVGTAIRGVLWDQGESGTQVTGVDQATLMGALIRGWRREWRQDFPFLYVQKPSGGGPAFDPTLPFYAKAERFAAQPAGVPGEPNPSYAHAHFVDIMKIPGTFMVTSSDLGSGTHPMLKSSYGGRGARVALGAVYGAKLEYLGPLYASHTLGDGKVRIAFTHVGKGLTARHADKLQGFTIAGADGKFAWADAVIDGAEVVVSSPAVPHPVAVRYAWSGRFPWANLFNLDGLPAQPFRTDR